MGGSSLNCPKFTKVCPFLFTLYACSGNYADIWPIISQIHRCQPQACFCFLSFSSFQTSYEMNIKPTNRTKGYYHLHVHVMVLYHQLKNNSKQPSG